MYQLNIHILYVLKVFKFLSCFHAHSVVSKVPPVLQPTIVLLLYFLLYCSNRFRTKDIVIVVFSLLVKATCRCKSMVGTLDITKSNLNTRQNCIRKLAIATLTVQSGHFSGQTEQIGSLITYQRGVLIKQSSLSSEREDRHQRDKWASTESPQKPSALSGSGGLIYIEWNGRCRLSLVVPSRSVMCLCG